MGRADICWIYGERACLSWDAWCLGSRFSCFNIYIPHIFLVRRRKGLSRGKREDGDHDVRR